MRGEGLRLRFKLGLGSVLKSGRVSGEIGVGDGGRVGVSLGEWIKSGVKSTLILRRGSR